MIPKPKPKLKNRGVMRWLAFRKRYLKDHPSVDGYYVCRICFKHIPEKEITLDHIIPRSRAPELRLEPSNIQLLCFNCNSAKGSKIVD